jgi:hypothetical protein
VKLELPEIVPDDWDGKGVDGDGVRTSCDCEDVSALSTVKGKPHDAWEDDWDCWDERPRRDRSDVALREDLRIFGVVRVGKIVVIAWGLEEWSGWGVEWSLCYVIVQVGSKLRSESKHRLQEKFKFDRYCRRR